jgi:hypothetical protein
MLLDEFIEFDMRVVAFPHGVEERFVDFAESFLLLGTMENSLAEIEQLDGQPKSPLGMFGIV